MIADYISRRDAPKVPCQCPKCKCDVGLETPREIETNVCLCCGLESYGKRGAKSQIPTPHHPKPRRQAQKRRLQ